MPWHITPVENVGSIIKDGLRPQTGSRSAKIPEDRDAVHLFSTLEDLESAEWLWEEFEDEHLALFHVAVEKQEGAWTECHDVIPSEKISMITRNIGEMPTHLLNAIRTLDLVVDPLDDIESFRATRVEMRADDFGSLVSDAQWEGDDSLMLVYAASFYIEGGLEGPHMCHILRDGWSSESGTSLAEMEEKLFEYAASERRPSLEDTPQP